MVNLGSNTLKYPKCLACKNEGRPDNTTIGLITGISLKLDQKLLYNKGKTPKGQMVPFSRCHRGRVGREGVGLEGKVLRLQWREILSALSTARSQNHPIMLVMAMKLSTQLQGRLQGRKKRTLQPPKENLLENFSGLKKKTFQAGGRYKNPIKNRVPPTSFPCGPHFFRKRKVADWSRVVYGFCFPGLGPPSPRSSRRWNCDISATRHGVINWEEFWGMRLFYLRLRSFTYS